MKLIPAILTVSASTLMSFFAYSSEDSNAYAPLEMATVTIRVINGHSYGELYPCLDGCALRLLPLTPDARIYLEGVLVPARELQNGQKLIGTIFLKKQPIDAIDQIVAK